MQMVSILTPPGLTTFTVWRNRWMLMNYVSSLASGPTYLHSYQCYQRTQRRYATWSRKMPSLLQTRHMIRYFNRLRSLYAAQCQPRCWHRNPSRCVREMYGCCFDAGGQAFRIRVKITQWLWDTLLEHWARGARRCLWMRAIPYVRLRDAVHPPIRP